MESYASRERFLGAEGVAFGLTTALSARSEWRSRMSMTEQEFYELFRRHGSGWGSCSKELSLTGMPI